MGKFGIWCALLFVVGLSGSEKLFAASNYVLDSQNSSLYFVSTKQLHVVESHYFTDLSGSITDQGQALLSINLSSVETGVEIRNERMNDLLFETVSFNVAAVTLSVDLDSIEAQSLGSTQSNNVSAMLNLHGMSMAIDAELSITKLTETTILVQNVSPVLISAEDFNLANGIEALRNIANLQVISYAVPVNFTLLFNTLEAE